MGQDRAAIRQIQCRVIRPWTGRCKRHTSRLIRAKSGGQAMKSRPIGPLGPYDLLVRTGLTVLSVPRYQLWKRLVRLARLAEEVAGAATTWMRKTENIP